MTRTTPIMKDMIDLKMPIPRVVCDLDSIQCLVISDVIPWTFPRESKSRERSPITVMYTSAFIPHLPPPRYPFPRSPHNVGPTPFSSPDCAPDNPGVNPSLISSCAFISFSCSRICCSSSAAIVNGIPTSKDVVTSAHKMRPVNKPTVFEVSKVVEREDVRRRRVEGGRMSLSAARRSVRDSETSGSESVSEREESERGNGSLGRGWEGERGRGRRSYLCLRSRHHRRRLGLAGRH